MKRYELKFIEGGRAVFKVSVVKDPAIESTLVHFAAEKEETHYFTDQEKRVIYSVVMRPNIDIFRKDINGEPAQVFYTSETVEQAQINYFRNNGNSATNINHSDIADAKGIFPFESWTVLDAKTDRAAVNFGLDVKDGDWVMGLKVDNTELWSEHIKTGKLDGFSIEATNINYEFKEEVNMKTDKTKKLSIIEKMRKIFFEGEIAEVSKWWNTVTNDTFELGETVMRKGFEEGDEPFAINSGEFELEDGSRILTDSEGIIRFIFPAAGAEDTDTDTDGDADATDGDDANMASDKDDDDKKAADAAKDDADKDADKDDDKSDDEPTEKETELAAEIIELKATIATLKADKVKDDTDLEKMAAEIVVFKKNTPAKKKIKDLPEPAALEMTAENYDKMNNREKMKFNRENKTY